MEELIFRAWVIETAKYISMRALFEPYMTGEFTFADFDGTFFKPAGCYYEDMTIMQYSGLKDKNSKKMFKGDIGNGRYGRFIVSFEDGGFIPFCGDTNVTEAATCEIIGNIFENPELKYENGIRK